MISLYCPAELRQCIPRGIVPVTMPINTIYKLWTKEITSLTVMSLCDWASWPIKNPEFGLSDDWLTFLLRVQIMGGGDRPQTFWGIQKQSEYYGEELRALRSLRLLYTGSLWLDLWAWAWATNPCWEQESWRRAARNGFLLQILLKATKQPSSKDNTTTKSPQEITKRVYWENSSCKRLKPM